MPKIFLIKNRLHEQQLRLLQQNSAGNKHDLGNILGDNQPLSLIVQKKEGKLLLEFIEIFYLKALVVAFIGCTLRSRWLVL